VNTVRLELGSRRSVAEATETPDLVLARQRARRRAEHLAGASRDEDLHADRLYRRKLRGSLP
jgi:hypothetical protein